jgi:2-dehydro-3-deoxygluconokinase
VILTRAQRTGFQFKGRVTTAAIRRSEYHRKGSAASQMGPADVDEAWLRPPALHATGVFAAISSTSASRDRRWTSCGRLAGRSFRPNLRPTLWSSTEVMRNAINDLLPARTGYCRAWKKACSSQARARRRASRVSIGSGARSSWS